jgi:hypothetical protein
VYLIVNCELLAGFLYILPDARIHATLTTQGR